MWVRKEASVSMTPTTYVLEGPFGIRCQLTTEDGKTWKAVYGDGRSITFAADRLDVAKHVVENYVKEALEKWLMEND